MALAHLPAAGQTPSPPLTLRDAIRTALRANPAVARVGHETAAARQRVREAQAGMLPNVAIQGSATDGPLGAPAMGLLGLAGDPLKKHFGGGLNVVQPLVDFGRTQHQVASRTALVRAAEQDTATQQAQVVLTIQEAYLDVLRMQQLVTVQQAAVRQRQATVQQAQTFADAGLKADVDVELAKADLADAEVALVAAQNDVRAAFAALNSALGDTRLTEYTLEPPAAPTAPAPPNSDAAAGALLLQAVRYRPEVRSAAQQVAAAEQSIRAARSDLLPRIDTIGSVGAVNPSPVITSDKDYAVGLSVTIPLYTGGAVEGRIAEERELRDAAVAQQRQVEEAVKLQVARALLNVRTRQAQLAAAHAQSEAAHSGQQQATQRYNLQLNTIVELTQAQAAAIRADTQLVNAQFDLDIARAELDWATGTILSTFGIK